MPSIHRSVLVSYVRPEWRRVVLLATVLIVGICLQLAGPQVIKVFIDQAQAGASFRELVLVAGLFLTITILTQAAFVAETFFAEDLGWRTTNALRCDLTRHVLNLDRRFHSHHSSGELMERIDGDVMAIADFFARFVVQIVGSGLFLLGVLILLFVADWRVGAVVIGFVLVAVLFLTRCGGFVGVRAGRSRRSAADLTALLEESLAALPDIKTNGADEHLISRMAHRLGDRFRTAWAAAMAGSIYNGTVSIIFALATGAVLVLSAELHSTGVMTLGTVFVAFRYTTMLQIPLERLSTQMNSFQQATGGLVRVRELLATENGMVSGDRSDLGQSALPVEADGVSFQYESDPVLHDVSFRVESGQVLGLLGRTGSGKTTISRLLSRLHDPVSGIVRLDGVDLREVDVDHLRKRVGVVTQDVQLFGGTLWENVALFDPAVSEKRVSDVFAELGLGPWLARLPAGLETELGPGKHGVSAGEAQLIALGRVLLRDPGLVILDEPSSRLDPVTEAFLEIAVTRLLAGRTGIIIAHRIPTVLRADSVLILDGGRVAEFGPRERLMADPDSRLSRLTRAGMTEVLA